MRSPRPQVHLTTYVSSPQMIQERIEALLRWRREVECRRNDNSGTEVLVAMIALCLSTNNEESGADSSKVRLVESYLVLWSSSPFPCLSHLLHCIMGGCLWLLPRTSASVVVQSGRTFAADETDVTLWTRCHTALSHLDNPQKACQRQAPEVRRPAGDSALYCWACLL